MSSRFIDRFDVILLDMGNTFMFGADRFSAAEDFGATYRLSGGRRLDGGEVSRMIMALFEHMLALARDPDFFDRYPTVMDCLKQLPESKGLPEPELSLLEKVFGRHEMGTVPESHAEALHELRKTHRLGLVSNIWAPSEPFVQELERVGVKELFDVLAFSSDHGCIKPSPRLFREALKAFDSGFSRVVFVGASHKRDVGGARTLRGADGRNDALRSSRPQPVRHVTHKKSPASATVARLTHSNRHAGRPLRRPEPPPGPGGQLPEKQEKRCLTRALTSGITEPTSVSDRRSLPIGVAMTMPDAMAAGARAESLERRRRRLFGAGGCDRACVGISGDGRGNAGQA